MGNDRKQPMNITNHLPSDEDNLRSGEPARRHAKLSQGIAAYERVLTEMESRLREIGENMDRIKRELHELRVDVAVECMTATKESAQ